MSKESICIEGIKIKQLNQIGDKRGTILHMIRCDEENSINIGECYHSEIFPKEIKAWKKHRVQIQNIAVPVGKIKLVMYDPRENSKTFGALQEIQLGRPDYYFRVTIPPNIWYGFMCISQELALITNCVNIPHDPKECDTINHEDKFISYIWED